MKLLTADIRDRLLRNGRLMQQLAGSYAEPDFLPVVQLFLPDAGCTWLLTELDPDEPDIAFGLCDLGRGAPNSVLSGFRSSKPCAAGWACRSSATCISLRLRRCPPTPTRRASAAPFRREGPP